MGENIANYSRVKCLAWSTLVIVASVWLVQQPFASGGFVMPQGKLALLWPIAALGTLYMVPLAVSLLFRSFLFGGTAIVKSGDLLIIKYVWKTQTLSLSDIKSVYSSEYKTQPQPWLSAATGPNYLNIPTTSFTPQVTIAMRNGDIKNVRTALLRNTAAQIADRISGLIR